MVTERLRLLWSIFSPKEIETKTANVISINGINVHFFTKVVHWGIANRLKWSMHRGPLDISHTLSQSDYNKRLTKFSDRRRRRWSERGSPTAPANGTASNRQPLPCIGRLYGVDQSWDRPDGRRDGRADQGRVLGLVVRPDHHLSLRGRLGPVHLPGESQGYLQPVKAPKTKLWTV